MNDKDLLAKSIVKGFAYAENNGQPDINNPQSGKTGEMKSIFQFTPNTWKLDSKKAFGKEMPMNSDNETYVMMHKVRKWIDNGLTTSQMASIHNAGASEPDAYTGKFSDGSSSVGVNKKYGVKFDVPGYAKKVVNYARQFYLESQSPRSSQTQSTLSGNLKGSVTGKIIKTKKPKLINSKGLLGQFSDKISN